MSRPEHVAPAEIFYNAEEAGKYSTNSRMIAIQTQMTQRAVELLNLPQGQECLLLDIGCGSGISGEELSADGHVWIGMDISPHMLGVALEKEVDGDLLWHDMGQGMGFRPGMFDGVISISALQWLCNADQKHHVPKKRMQRFFATLYACMARGARAVFQFYPETPQQLELLTQAAMKAGFTGGVVVDFPNSTKAKKVFLCLFAGTTGQLPKGLEGEPEDEHTAQFNASVRAKNRGREKKVSVKSKEWVLKKKEKARRQGKETQNDSKYTARKRKPRV
eukprot:comp11422_c0_seq1/m.5825 comp11422_c0_seq1/g.5825  ORF comp11422_c0_seq1/g.5825 comp11422_c0_seq1/m.5825 type:complete len:277 (-) comp11422_c0_seq1:5-835(-)